MQLYWAEAVTGAAVGGLYALVAVGITQIYKVTRVFNFAHAGFFLWGAYLYSQFTFSWHLDIVLSAILAIAATACMGVLTQLLIFKFAFRSTSSSKIILTFGLLEFLTSMAFWVWGTNPRGATPLVTRNGLGFLGTEIGWNQLAEVIAAIIIVALLGVYLRYTRLGLLTRATAEDSTMAELLGARPILVGSISWAIAAGIAAVAGIFVATAQPLTLDLFYTFFITSLVAVVFGGLTSLTMTLIGGLLLGVAINEITATEFSLGNFCIFAVLVAIVLLKRNWPEDLSQPHGPGGVITRDESRSWTLSSLFAVVFIGGWLALMIMGLRNVVWGITFDLALIYCLACLSLVPIARWTGQVTLAQGGLMGIGAFAMASFDLHDHIPFVLAVLFASLLTAAFGAAFGLIVRRLSFVLAAVLSLEFMNITGMFQGGQYAPWVARLGLGGIYMQTPAYVNTWDKLGVALVLVALLVTLGLRTLSRSSWGMRLAAARVSPTMALHFGVRPTITRVYSYAISGFIAGIAGAAYVLFLTDVQGGTFSSTLSLYILIYVVVGGVSALWGPFIGALLFIGFPEWIGLNRFGESPLPLIVQGALLVILCAVSLDGLVGLGRHPSTSLPSFGPARRVVARFAPGLRKAVEASSSISSLEISLPNTGARPEVPERV